MDILEKDLLPRTSDNLYYRSAGYYVIGLANNKLGEYVKAANAFKNSYQADANFQYADYCLFAQGYCYEKLLEQGAVPASEAKSIIMIQYYQLISEFPKSCYALYAQNWLEKNSQ